MSNTRYGREFADGCAFGDDPSFAELTDFEQAMTAAWSNGCPVPVGLVKPVEDGGKGIEYMRDRYIRINFWFGYIKDILKKTDNIGALLDFAGMNSRPEGEELGKHEPESIPDSLSNFTMGAGAALGYAFPRVIIEFMGNNMKERVIPVMDLLDAVLIKDADITDAMLTFAESLLEFEANIENKTDLARRLLRHIVSRGKLKEDNCYTMYRKIFASMQVNAPFLWETFCSTKDVDKDKIGITLMKPQEA